MRYLSILLIIISLFAVVTASAQVVPTQAEPVLPKITFPAGKAFVEIPFEISGNWMVIPVTIDGSRQLKFVLDTGAQATVLQNADVASSLGLKVVGKMPVRGAGNGPAGEVSIAQATKLNIGGVEWSDVRVALPPPRMPGIDGAVGRMVFTTAVVEVDWEKKIIRLYDPASFKYAGKGAVLPLTFDEGGRPYTEASVAVSSDKFIPIKVVVDTGGSHNLSLDAGSKPEIKAPEGAAKVILGRGASGDIVGVNGTVRSFQLGGLTVSDIPTMFPDPTPGMTGVGGRQGSVGSGILRRFKAIYDYSRKQMIIEPNRFLADPFGPLPSPRTAAAAATVPSAQDYVGEYGIRSVTLEKGDLFLARQGGTKIKMIATGKDEFGLELIPTAKIRFVRGQQGRITEIQVLNREGAWENAKRSQP